MQQRYYDPVIGRFYSNDPLSFRDTHSFNRYAYANNNPYKYVDPFGMASEKPNVMETEAARRRESCFKDPNCSHHEFQRAELERPDSDKDLTYDEANGWYNNGGGQPLYVPLESISISKISSTQFKGVGTSRYFNLFNPLYGATFEDASTFGSITLTLINDNTVKATFGFDNYNFDLKPWNGFENHLRNYLTVIGKDRAGPGESFKIYLYGVAEINK